MAATPWHIAFRWYRRGQTRHGGSDAARRVRAPWQAPGDSSRPPSHGPERRNGRAAPACRAFCSQQACAGSSSKACSGAASRRCRALCCRALDHGQCTQIPQRKVQVILHFAYRLMPVHCQRHHQACHLVRRQAPVLSTRLARVTNRLLAPLERQMLPQTPSIWRRLGLRQKMNRVIKHVPACPAR